MVSKHTKPNANNPQGGITKQEAPYSYIKFNWLILQVVIQPGSQGN
jgi:hypothetical protein